MSDDDPRPPPHRPAVHLLDELESIKGVLADRRTANSDLPADIPLLEDMVIEHLDDNANLLNIEQIFDDAADAMPAPNEWVDMPFPRFTLDVAISDGESHLKELGDALFSPASISPVSIPAAPAFTKPPSTNSASVRPDCNRERLIRELVDEFIPQIEAELQKRLRRLDAAALRRLKDSE